MKVILMHTGPLSVNTYLVCNEAAREMLVIDPGALRRLPCSPL